MLRTVLAALAILHLGPGLAFFALAFGCEDGEALLGALCGHNSIITFAGVTVLTWLVLAVAYAVYRAKSQTF